MANQSSDLLCPRCGEATAGRYCVACGVAVRDVACAACGTSAPAGARFCPDCGSPLGAASAGSPVTAARTDPLTKLIAGAAILVLVAFVAGEAAGRRSGGGAVQADQGGPAPTVALSSTSAPDISAMSPEERASRLFNRVMLYTEQGKMDSARFFAPMAIQSYAMIGPLDAHAHYDIGVISAAVRDGPRAKAEADTILAAHPNHLLGLVLEIRAAELSGDSSGAARFTRRLAAAAPTERSTALKEYEEHGRDIDDALKKATLAGR
jgi:hypothetical protein